jgi:hypothetical protein
MPVLNNQVAPIQTRNQRYALSNSRSIQPDMYRTKFRATERQIQENQPGQIGMNFVEQAKSKGQADINEQYKGASEGVGKMGPDVSQFMPVFQQSVGGNQEARSKTAENLRAFMPEYKPMDIDAAMEDEAQALLGQQNRGGYLSALLAERGGGLSGANRLDAAILDRSGAGRQQFEEGRKQLAGFADQGDVMEKQLTGQYDQKKADLKKAQDAILWAAGQESTKLKDLAEGNIAKQARAMPWGDIESIKQEAKTMRPELTIFDLPDYSPFLDRNLSFEEALSGADADTYNYLSSLTGKNPTLFRAQDPTVNRSALLNALLANAQAIQEKQDKLTKGKTMQPGTGNQPFTASQIPEKAREVKKESKKDVAPFRGAGVGEKAKNFGAWVSRMGGK